MLPRRSLGADGPDVALLGLGGNVFGPPRLDLTATRRVVDAAADLGVDLVDTANVYNGGDSESFLGEVLAGRRDRWVVATKFNLRGLDGDVAAHVRTQLEASLRRLRTDRVDLYQLHHAPADEIDMPLVLEVLDSLVREGRVRAIGASNFGAWRLAECAALCRENGWTPFATVQDYWHLLARGIETEVVPYAARTGIGVIPFHPLGGGYLTGKYEPGVPRPAGTRGAAGSGIVDALDAPDIHARVVALQGVAREHGRTVGELAIAWLANQPVVSTVIAGASDPQQVALNVAGASWVLDEDTLGAVEAIVPAPLGPETLPYALASRR